MAFTPASIVSQAPSLYHLKSVWLSRESGYKVSIVTGVPSVSDPAAQTPYMVKVENEHGEWFSVSANENDNMNDIMKNIKKHAAISKWNPSCKNVVNKNDDRPAADLVEYILKFKAKQEKKNGQASIPVVFLGYIEAS